jgi:integrase/recombinase XerD
MRRLAQKNREHDISETIENKKIQELMEEFLLQADIARSSKITYKKGLRKFFLWLKENLKTKIERKTIIEYKNFLFDISLRPHTQEIYLNAIKQFFKWTESSLIFPNIAYNIKGIKKISKQHHKNPLTKEEVIKLLRIASEGKDIVSLRNKALIMTLIFTGIRIGESGSILIKDIEQINEEKHIIWIKGKGRTGKDNFVILLEETWQSIKEYLFERNKKKPISEEEFLFSSHQNRTNQSLRMHTDSIGRIVNTYLKKADIKKNNISPHSLRHTFGTAAIEAGVPLHDLQIAMRHSSSTTTQVYLGDIEKKKRKEASSEKKVRDFLLGKEEK